MTPDPGREPPPTQLWEIMLTEYPDCVQAIAQLVTMGSFNISTDVVLILIPLPLVIKSGLPSIRYRSLEISSEIEEILTDYRKLQLFLLFSVGLFVVCITIIRMPVIISDKSVQKARTLVCNSLLPSRPEIPPSHILIHLSFKTVGIDRVPGSLHSRQRTCPKLAPPAEGEKA